MNTVTNIDWQNKIAVLRADLNVPIEAGVVTDATRITAATRTILHILHEGGGVVLLTHLGRPTENEFDEMLSTKVLVEVLSEALACSVRFAREWEGKIAQPQEVVLMENTRFNKGEKADSDELAKRYALLGDVFVMDAFASAHRSECSITGVTRHLPSCAGLLLMDEITALQAVMVSQNRPYIGILGGAKIATKLGVVNQMAESCDKLLIGGGMANTLLAALGYQMGDFPEKDRAEIQQQAMEILQVNKDRIVLPEDVAVADDVNSATVQYVDITAVKAGSKVLDIGPKTINNYQNIIAKAQTILWNGPVGLFEKPPFAVGTKAIAEAVAGQVAYSVVGGGDTIAACNHFGVTEKISYISTGGGALLEYLGQGSLPGIDAIT